MWEAMARYPSSDTRRAAEAISFERTPRAFSNRATLARRRGSFRSGEALSAAQAVHGRSAAERRAPPKRLAPASQSGGYRLARPVDLQQPCLTQEFVDKYGEFEPVPREAKPGAKLRAAGTIAQPLVFGGVGIGRTPLPRPMPRERLNGGVYRIPAPDTMYYPAGFKTPKPVKVDGQRFSIDLVLGKAAGSYAVSIWAKTARFGAALHDQHAHHHRAVIHEHDEHAGNVRVTFRFGAGLHAVRNRVTVRILEHDLFAARPHLHLVAKTSAGFFERGNARSEIVDVKMS